MLLQGRNNKVYAVLVIGLLLAGIAAWFFMRRTAVADKAPASPPAYTTMPATDTIPAPREGRWLADSTHVYLLGDTKLTPAAGYPGRREITLDGDAFFDATAAPSVLTIHTKLLTLTVRGRAAFRVMAPSKEEWTEVDVIRGIVIARKAYESTFNEPDTLSGGEMQMLNRSIDLAEKEVFDTTALKAWRERQPVRPAGR